MSSSIEEQFQPPEWATRDEVIKAAQHYINYWKIEARHRNQQWLNAVDECSRLREDMQRMAADSLKDISLMQELRAENERLHAAIISREAIVTDAKPEEEPSK